MNIWKRTEYTFVQLSLKSCYAPGMVKEGELTLYIYLLCARYGEGGGTTQADLLCLLPLNIIHDKVQVLSYFN